MKALKVFLLLAALAAVFALGWITGRRRGADTAYRGMHELVFAMNRVRQSYVEEVDPQKLVEGAVRGMLHTLDAHSTFLDRADFDNLEDNTQGEFEGLGIVVDVRDHYPTVISPIEGGPAGRAGLRAGDRIVKIDGTGTEDWDPQQAMRHLRGPAGTWVLLTISREGADDQDYRVRRAKVSVRSVPYSFMATPTVGYVRLTQFSERSRDEVHAALDSLQGRGMKALVLDLRDNPGGLLDQAVQIAEEFVPAGETIVSTRGRGREQNKTFRSRARHVRGPLPIAVLVNGGTASASEVLAGALQDLDLAVVVGATSFGKGSVQSVFEINDTTAIKLTVARYYTPSGRSIQRADHERELLAEEDEESALPPPDTTAASRPVYHTVSGRVVRGGGGIVPDLAVADTSVSPLMSEVFRHGLLFRYATHYVSHHPRATAATLSGEDRAAFEDSVRASVAPAAMKSWPEERSRLTGLEEAEIARRLHGENEGQRLALETDPTFTEALRMLRRARSAPELLRLAAAEQVARTGGGPRHASASGSGPAPHSAQ